MRTDIMIDLETVGNDHDGLFTTIGACDFDIESGGIRSKFYEHINWESALETDRTVTPSAVKWWMEQPQDARAQIIKEGRDIHEVLVDFADWIMHRTADPIVWGNGPISDIVKLESVYGYYNIPWSFRDVRCVRTICDLSQGLFNRNDIPFEGVKHNALDDAIHQAKYVSAMWETLRSGRTYVCTHPEAALVLDEEHGLEKLVCQKCGSVKVRGKEDLTPWERFGWVVVPF